MRQTIAEKLLSRHNLTGAPANAGEFIGARIDGAMCHYQFMDIHRLAVEAGFEEGFPRVWDTERVYLLVDHHQPALSQSYADENVLMRKEAKRLPQRPGSGCVSLPSGVSPPPTAVDGRFGLLEVFSGETAKPDQLILELGKCWAVKQVFTKVYPVCSWIQATVQQLVALRGPQPLKAQQIKHVRIGVCAYAIRGNGAATPPDTMGAQYSLPYCAALALTADPSDPAMFAREAINEPSRRELARRIELVVDPELEAAYPKHYGARVELELVNGERRGSAVLDPHGMPADPCTEAERLDKFTRLASHVKPSVTVAEIIRKVRSSERLKSVRELTDLLRN